MTGGNWPKLDPIHARSSWYMEVSHAVHRAAFCGCNSAFYKSVVVSKNVENFEMIQFLHFCNIPVETWTILGQCKWVGPVRWTVAVRGFKCSDGFKCSHHHASDTSTEKLWVWRKVSWVFMETTSHPFVFNPPINTNAFEDHLTEPGTRDASYREFWSKYVQTTSIFFNVFQMISTRTIWLLLSLILLNKNSVLTNTSFVEAFHQDIYIQVNLQLTCVSQVLFKQTYNKGTMTKRVADLELPSKTNW